MGQVDRRTSEILTDDWLDRTFRMCFVNTLCPDQVKYALFREYLDGAVKRWAEEEVDRLLAEAHRKRQDLHLVEPREVARNIIEKLSADYDLEIECYS